MAEQQGSWTGQSQQPVYGVPSTDGTAASTTANAQLQQQAAAWQQQFFEQFMKQQQQQFTPEQLAQYQAFYQHFQQQLVQSAQAQQQAVTAAIATPQQPQQQTQYYQPQMMQFSSSPQQQPQYMQPQSAPAPAPAPEIDMTSTIGMSYLAQNYNEEDDLQQQQQQQQQPQLYQQPYQQQYPAQPQFQAQPVSDPQSQHFSSPKQHTTVSLPNDNYAASPRNTMSWGSSTIAPPSPGAGVHAETPTSPLIGTSAATPVGLQRSDSFGMSTVMPSFSSSLPSMPSSQLSSSPSSSYPMPTAPLSVSAGATPASPLARTTSYSALGAEGGEENNRASMTSSGAFTGPKSPPAPGSRDVVRDDLVFFSKNFQIVIKGGTVDKLVERLTFESTTDSDYVETFLLTYRSMLAPSDLLERLFNRYEHGMSEVEEEGLSHLEAETLEKKQKIIRLRVGNVLKRWLSEHFHDFSKDPTLLDKLNANLARIQEKGLVAQLEKAIADAQAQSQKKKDFTFSTPPPASIIPKTATIEDFDPLEIARQLCLIEQEIYTAIHPKEALNQSWNKKKDQAPNIIKMIHFFNVFSKWVSTKLVSEPDLKARVKLLKKFVQTLVYLRQYNNFDSMQAILAGLNNAAIFRLKLTWAKVEKEKFWPQFCECRDLMDSTGSFANYRKNVQQADPPIIPYLGVYLTDLTFIEDGNPQMLPVQDGRTDIVNFEKMRKVATVIKDICTYQQTPYNFSKVDVIYNFFTSGKLETLEDGPLFKKSREIESPQVQEAKLKKKDSSLLRKFSFSSSAKKSGTPEK